MLFTVVEIVVLTLACCAASVHCIHALQMGRYQLPAYRQWLARSRDRIFKENVLWSFGAALARAYLPVLLMSGMIAGLFTGLCAQALVNRMAGHTGQ